MNADRTLILREPSTIFDVFSNIGGLYSLIFTVLVFIVSLINYNYMDNYMVAKLFKIEKENKDDLNQSE